MAKSKTNKTKNNKLTKSNNAAAKTIEEQIATPADTVKENETSTEESKKTKIEEQIATPAATRSDDNAVDESEEEITQIEQTDEEKILGVPAVFEKSKKTSYEDPNRLYKVTNLLLNNNPTFVYGEHIEAFIGMKNKVARVELKKGAKSVTTQGTDGKPLYKIEVVE